MIRLLALACAAALAWAGEAALLGIDGMVIPDGPPRAAAPIPVTVQLSARGGAREGHVRIVLLTDDREAGAWSGPDWRIGADPSRFRVLLPPPHTSWPGSELRLRLSWIGDDGAEAAIDTFRIGAYAERRRLAAEIAPAGRGGAIRRLAIPPATDPALGLPEQPQPLFTAIAPADAPASPVAWCAYDAVLIHPDAALPAAAVEGLSTWTAAGGRILVAPGAAGPAVQDLLARCRRTTVGSAGGAELTGLGRLVVARPGMDQAATAEALWGPPADPTWRRRYGYDPTPALSALLWPEGVGAIPLPLVLGVFAAFLVWIGPVEWWLLGRIRRRRWTWITFPLAAIAATTAVAMIARSTLGGQDHLRRLVVVDCDRAGIPRRTITVELRFTAGDSATVLKPHAEVVCAMPGSDERRGGGAMAPLRSEHRGPWYDGGEVEIGLPQWTPVLVVRTGFAAPAGPDPGWAGAAADQAQAMRRALERGFLAASSTSGDGGGATTIGSTERFTLRDDPDAWRDPDRARRGHAMILWLLGGDQHASPESPSAGFDLVRSPAPSLVAARRDGGDIIVWRRPLAAAEPGGPAE